MAAILYAFRRPSYAPETEVKAAVKIAKELLVRIEQEEDDYLRRRAEDEMYLRPAVQSQE